jgi:hypothetical protein
MFRKPRLSTLGFVGFQVNSAISNGHANAFSFHQIYLSLELGTLLENLERMLPEEFDLRLFPPESEEAVALNETLHEAAEGLRGRERGKVGLEKPGSGLHLLLALILEAMQQQYWVLPKAKTEMEQWLEANEAEPKKGSGRLPS